MEELYLAQNSLVWKEGKVKGFTGAELLTLGNGTVKLVRVNPKADYPVHIHPDRTEFLYVLKGVVRCQVETNDYVVKQGDFMIFPASTKHKIENNSINEATLLVGSIKQT